MQFLFFLFFNSTIQTMLQTIVTTDKPPQNQVEPLKEIIEELQIDKYLVKFGINAAGQPFARLIQLTPKARYAKSKVLYNYYFTVKSGDWEQRINKRDALVLKWVNDINRQDRRKAEDQAAKALVRKQIKEKASDLVKVGDIFYSSWGYEQTNIDFYQIVDVNGVYAVLAELCQERETPEGYASDSGTCIPIPGKYLDRKQLRKKIQAYKRDDGSFCVSFKIESYAYAHKWDGKPLYWSAYY